MKIRRNQRRPSKIKVLLKNSPAIAGLFYLIAIEAAEVPQLSTSGQEYFRRFIEQFTPLLIRNEKRNPGLNFRWDSTNRDCAGLVRYIFYEALSPHSESFFIHYPEMVLLGNYANSTEFSQISHNWKKKNHTTPELLLHARYLGRDTTAHRLKTGDILYYASTEWRIRHVMLVVRSGRAVFLVYHTGDQRNELRIRTLEDMLRLEQVQWHPTADNPVFRGVYRPNFLE